MNCAVQVCPDRDVECGMFPRSWCAACPLRAPHDLAKTVAYAEAEYASWDSNSLQYFRFCAGCAFCNSGGWCSLELKTTPLSFD